MRVIGGRYEGDTGLIVRVEENLIVLFSDLTMHELKTMPKDLQLCTDMATGVDSLGQYQFGDLVQIDAQVAAGQGAVPGNTRQHSVEGEQCAMMQGLVHAQPGVAIQCDCAAVVARALQCG